MKKTRIYLTLDIPLAPLDKYPTAQTDEERARLEWLSMMNNPARYIEIALEQDSGWISGSNYRFVDDKIAGEQ